LTSVAAIATAVAYGIGGHLAISGQLTVGTLLAITALLARLYGPLTALSNVRVDVMSALVSFERVFEVLDLKPMVTDKLDAIELISKKLDLKFESVSFSYPIANEVSIASLESIAKPELVESGEVLKGISFTAAASTMTGIVGLSGSGKTTIASLIPRLYDVTNGSISIDGIDIRDYSLTSLRKVIGVVTQDAHMFHDTIRNNLKYANNDASDTEIKQACSAARIWEFIENLPNGLETVVGERGHRLSGGEKQRLAIARMLLKRPSIVILDEATAHLDSENESLVQSALKEALIGRTSIVIAHRLSTIMHADQILVVDKGEILERGSHEQLVEKKGIYFDLYEMQNLNDN
jgi:ATP-binding cassette subfamily B protein